MASISKPAQPAPTSQAPPAQQMHPSVNLVQPEPQQRPGDLKLGKLFPFLRDQSIQSIECPGPDKNLLIKRYGKINATRVSLNQVEITKFVNDFAQEARIPIVGGILKAAVGDLVVSAVISDFVGSRFIINKIVPYNLMGMP